MNNKIKFLSTFLLFALFLACKNEKKNNPNHDPEIFSYHDVVPTEFPKLNIEGFNFPEDSVKINAWVHSSDMEKIYLHSWGIWTGLTTLTKQQIPGDAIPLRVYETWLTPEEMIDAIKNNPGQYKPMKRSNRANLNRPHQLTHFSPEQQTINDSIHESVSYNPTAAKFAIDNKIFMATTLYDYAKKQNRKEIPFFPSDAITIKPVFKLLPASGGETLFNISAWRGPTDELVAYPEKDWASFVTINIANQGKGDGSTYNLDDFIHYKLNKEDAHFFNKEFTENELNKFNAKPGDIALLVGMHVGTREITNWTWQTYWWDSNPDNPPAPSSKAIADMRPEELKGAARHYAMAVAYYMVNPNEPYDGENIIGEPNYAFNPYLEAGFGPVVFNDSISYVNTADKKIKTYVGVRTNCMSCHRMATVNPNLIYDPKNNFKTPYVGNSYVSRSDSLFKRQLLLDFAWSINGNVDTTGIKKHIGKHIKEK